MPRIPIAYSYVRFSTIEQELGSTVARQVDRYRAYCTRRGLERDETLIDRGKSGYHGKHLEKGGALRRFFDMIRTPQNPTGKVQPGDFLIVENLDRYSRQNPLTALPHFIEIINAGIIVVTLEPEYEFSTATLEERPYLLQFVLMEMMRAHGESKRKADLVCKGFERLRDTARAKKRRITKRCPNWLYWAGDDETGVFDFRPGLKALVNRIADMAISGLGPVSIGQTLNREGVPGISNRKKSRKTGKPLTGRKIWEVSTIKHMLRSRTLIGEYQPHKMVNGKPVAVGDPIKGYYPSALSVKKYFAVQKVLNSRMKNVGRGRTGKVSNLFGRILKDGFDGSTMTLSQKHKVYNIVSLNYVRGLASANSFPYPPFESAFLTFIREIDLKSIGGEVSRMDELKGRLSDLQIKMDKLEKLIDASGTAGFERLIKMMKAMAEEENELKKEIEAERLDKPTIDTSDITAFVATMESGNGLDVRNVRERLRAAIQQLCSEIRLYVFSKTVTRLAVVYVRFASGADRVFAVRVRRNKPTIAITDGIFYGGYASPVEVQKAVAAEVAPWLLEDRADHFRPTAATLKRLDKIDDKAASAYNHHAGLLVSRLQGGQFGFAAPVPLDFTAARRLIRTA